MLALDTTTSLWGRGEALCISVLICFAWLILGAAPDLLQLALSPTLMPTVLDGLMLGTAQFYPPLILQLTLMADSFGGLKLMPDIFVGSCWVFPSVSLQLVLRLTLMPDIFSGLMLGATQLHAS